MKKIFMQKVKKGGANESFFILSDKEILDIKEIPMIEIPLDDLKDLRKIAKTKENLPCVVGVLLQREGEDKYSIDSDYLIALLQQGLNFRFLTYEKITEQLKGLNGILLPGGSFYTPFEMKEPLEENLLRRYYAYETLVHYAEKKGFPLLGICAGMQMMACALVKNPKEHPIESIKPSKIIHKKDKKEIAHEIEIQRGSYLEKILGEKVGVNSSHLFCLKKECFEKDKNFQIIAYALDDVPEAISFSNHPNWIAVQFHPEVLACLGNTQMQNIFQLFAKNCLEIFQKN